MRTVTVHLLTLLVIGLFMTILLSSCMKKQCISCTTQYPEITGDTFHMQTRTNQYCDVTVEKGDHLERLGNKDTLLLLNGHVVPVRITTDCE